MFNWLIPLLNIKQSEARLVKQLFLIQFVLGVATAFLLVGSLTLFIHEKLPIKNFALVYIIAALALVVFNEGYAYVEKRKSSAGLLKLIVIFSGGLLLLLWIGLRLFHSHAMVMLLSVGYILIYMLIGYAFWGMAAMMFSVRESKRIFSIVGAGDIPAKMLGYAFVTVIAKIIGDENMMWISILAFVVAFFLISNLSKDNEVPEEQHPTAHHPIASASKYSILQRIVDNKLIFSISLLTVMASIVFCFVDITFISEIKSRVHNSDYEEQYKGIATLIGSFFALGRAIALLIKFVFSSRMIARMGLTNALLLTPLLLLVATGIILFFHNNTDAYLYIFGTMVLIIEILRSVVQEPVFFILFQPLSPHDRLKGHLIAKGYTFPIALLFVGIYIIVYLQGHTNISIPFIAILISIFLLFWIATVYLVKGEYMHTLLHSIKKGYFTGEDMFLNDESVTKVLLSKLNSDNPVEVVNALGLLERSQYNNKYQLLLNTFQTNSFPQVQTYVLSRIIDNKMKAALPVIKEKLEYNNEPKPTLIKAFFYLEDKDVDNWKQELEALEGTSKKEAFVGLLLREDTDVTGMVCSGLINLVESGNEEDGLLVCDIIVEAGRGCYTEILMALFQHPSLKVVGKAVEAAGKLKDFDVYKAAAEVSAQNKLYYAYQRSLVYYGDTIFSEDYITATNILPALVTFMIEAAAKIKGPYSEKFLLELLKENQYADKVIHALWQRKKVEDATLIESWIETKLSAAQEKTTHLKTLLNFPHTGLLQQAISSEIHQDVEVLLKGATLIYDRDLINRFLEIYKQGNTHKVANALELLELTIHKKYFIALNEMVELSMDLKHKKIISPLQKFEAEDDTMKHIITGSNANFTAWTRSVAVFILPQLHNIPETVAALRNIHNEEAIFMETRNYVLSILK